MKTVDLLLFIEIEKIKNLALDYAPKLASAIFVVIIGLWVVSWITKWGTKILKKSDLDSSLESFLISILNVVLKLLLAISVMSMLGVQMTSLVAILGAASLAVGMALSGTLQNFASGVMILLFKPFKTGDVIEAASFTGAVEEIQVFNTILKTPDNRRIIVPNNEIAGKSIVNYSAESTRRVDLIAAIGYGDDYDHAKKVIDQMIKEDKRILTDPEAFVGISELADNSVNISLRLWVKQADYWDVYFDMNEKIYKRFDSEGLNIPYPQMDVHIHNPTK